MDIDWSAIRQRLAEPFDAALIDFKPGAVNQETGKAVAMAYIDARAVAERLDAGGGPEAWSFTWEPIITEEIPGVRSDTKNADLLGTHCRVVRGTLIIHGVVKQDVGTASDTEPDKGAVSDALKRCAVLWGIGRELYDLPHLSMEMDKNHAGKYAWPKRGEVDRLRQQVAAHLRGQHRLDPRPQPTPRPHLPPAAPPVEQSDASPLTARFVTLLTAGGSTLAEWDAARAAAGKPPWADLTPSQQERVLDVFERRAALHEVPA
jgi:hypothetical protein